VWAMGGTQSDLAIAYYALAAFAVLRTAPPGASAGAYRLAGSLAGFALAMRLSALPFLAGIALVQIVAERPRPRLVVDAAVCFVATACPWFILRFIETGNPVFPLYNDIFRSTMGPPVNPTYNFELFGFGKGTINAIRLPFDITIDSDRFQEAVPFGVMGAAILVSLAAPLATVGRWRVLLRWVAPAAIGVAAWFFVAQYLRYLLPALPFICTAAALVIVAPLRRVSRRLGPPIAAALVTVLVVATGALSFAAVWRISERLPVDYVFGAESKDAFLLRILPSYPLATYLRSLDTTSPGEGDRLLKYDSSLLATAYAGRPGTEAWDFSVLQATGLPTAGERVDALLANGYRWLVLYTLSSPYTGVIEDGGFRPDFLGPRATPVYARNSFVLYELHARKPPANAHRIRVCDASFDSPALGCWRLYGSVQLVPSPYGAGMAAELPSTSTLAQKVAFCPGAVHKLSLRAAATAPGGVLTLTLAWQIPGQAPLREDLRIPLTSTDPVTVAALSSAPTDASSGDLTISSGGGTIRVDDLRITALSGGPC
jgi:hypothetical protein